MYEHKPIPQPKKWEKVNFDKMIENVCKMTGQDIQWMKEVMSFAKPFKPCSYCKSPTQNYYCDEECATWGEALWPSANSIH